MHGLADVVVASERERQVADTTADVSSWEVLTYPLGGTDEVNSIESKDDMHGLQSQFYVRM